VLVLGTLLALASRLLALGRRHLRLSRNHCPRCNYNLSGLAPYSLCPECGGPR
jgi:hypothetical protein